MKRMKRWQMQEAKARLSELIKATGLGPQEITVHGKTAAVVLSKDDFDRMQGPKLSFVEFLRRSPLRGLELGIERDKSPTRRIRL